MSGTPSKTKPAHAQAPRQINATPADWQVRPHHEYNVYARARAGTAGINPQFDAEPIDHFYSEEYVKDGFALRIHGDSMTNLVAPYHFPDRSYVLVNPHISPDVGEFVAVVDLDGEGGIMVKQYQTAMSHEGLGNVPVFVSLNPAYPPIFYDESKYKILGVVVDTQIPAYNRRRSKITRR